MNHSPENKEDDVALAGEYVLGLLNGPELQAFEGRLAADAALKQQVGFWAQHFGHWSAKGVMAEAGPVSPLVWQRIQASLWSAAGTNHGQVKVQSAVQVGASVPKAVGLRDFWRLWLGYGAGFVTACAVGFAVYVVQPKFYAPSLQEAQHAAPRYVAVLKSPDKTAEWLIEALPNDTIRLYQLGQLPETTVSLAQGKSLELWTKAGADAPLTSLGLVELGKPWVLSAKALPALQNNQLFAVSLEPPNGAPHGQPTGPVVMAGETVALQ